MTQGQALLQAVITDPDDDDVRLVYADWLTDHGDPDRAEFIRLQIGRARLPKKDRTRHTPTEREVELVGRHAATWLEPLPAWARPREERPIATEADWFGFRRGFLQGVCAPPEVATFLDDAPAVFATEPVTHFYLSEAGFLPRLARSAEFLGLVGLRFGHFTLDDNGAVALSRLPAMPRLRQLWLYRNEIGDRGLRALARWEGLATVEELQLGFNDFHAPGLKALMASPYVTRLKSLDLTDSLIAPKTKQALKERFGKGVAV